MTGQRNTWTQSPMNRRSFVGFGVKTAAIFALPAASSLLASCGGGEERAKPAPSAPAPRTVEPEPKATPAPKTAAPTQTPPDGDRAPLVTEVPAAAALVQAMQYVNPSPKPDQLCSNCQLYTAQSGKLGKCQLFPQGLVEDTAWCSSWAARVGSEAS